MARNILQKRIIAAIPERIVEEDVVVGFETQTTGPFFSNDCVKEAAFYWTADNNNYTGLNTNLGFTQSPSKFITDNESVASRKNILRSESHTEGQIKNERNQIDHFNIIAKEKYKDTTSEVYIIGSTEIELREFILNQRAKDRNVLIYRSMLRSVNDGDEFLTRIAQLGGWTNRTTFKDGREDSYLEELFAFLPDVAYNVNDLENHILTSTYDAAWIANTDQTIPSEDLNVLKAWPSQGDRKLFITCGREDSSRNQTITDQNIPLENIEAVEFLVAGLELNIKPLRLPVKNKVASTVTSSQTLPADI